MTRLHALLRAIQQPPQHTTHNIHTTTTWWNIWQETPRPQILSKSPLPFYGWGWGGEHFVVNHPFSLQNGSSTQSPSYKMGPPNPPQRMGRRIRKLPIPRPCLCQRTEEPRKSRRSTVRALKGCDKHYMGVREFPHNSMRHKRWQEKEKHF